MYAWTASLVSEVHPRGSWGPYIEPDSRKEGLIVGAGDKFNEFKDKAEDVAENAKDKAGDVFNKAKESPAGEKAGDFADSAKEKAQEAVSKIRGDRGD